MLSLLWYRNTACTKGKTFSMDLHYTYGRLRYYKAFIPLLFSLNLTSIFLSLLWNMIQYNRMGVNRMEVLVLLVAHF